LQAKKDYRFGQGIGTGGAFAILLEMVPDRVQLITERLKTVLLGLDQAERMDNC
jgi:ketopantoate hydroxymethyltransferase